MKRGKKKKISQAKGMNVKEHDNRQNKNEKSQH